jgi:hypothetical protein
MTTKQRSAQAKFKEDYTLFSKLKKLFSKNKPKTKKYTMILHYPK